MSLLNSIWGLNKVEYVYRAVCFLSEDENEIDLIPSCMKDEESAEKAK